MSKIKSESDILKKNYFRPAKYFVPAAIMFALLNTGCDDSVPQDDDGNNTGNTGNTTTADTTIDNPVFKAPVSITGISSFSNYIFVPTLADMDGDGDLDILAGFVWNDSLYDEQGIKYYSNESDTSITFNSSPSSDLSNTPWDIFYASSLSYAVGPMFPAVIDKDGDDDTVYYSSNSYSSMSGPFNRSVIEYCSNTDMALAEPSNIFVSNYSYNAIAFVDIDGDDDMDMAVGSTYLYSSSPSYIFNSKIFYYRNEGNDLFGDNVEINLVTQMPADGLDSFPVPSFVDIDNDGDQDMFVTMYDTGNISFYLNEGTSTLPNFTLQADAVSNMNLPDDGVHYFPAFGDLDSDGDMDIVAGTNDGRILLIENNDIQ